MSNIISFYHKNGSVEFCRCPLEIVLPMNSASVSVKKTEAKILDIIRHWSQPDLGGKLSSVDELRRFADAEGLNAFIWSPDCEDGTIKSWMRIECCFLSEPAVAHSNTMSLL